MRRLATTAAFTAAITATTTGVAWACSALIGPNGAVVVERTTTLAAYHVGVEHYVTSFAFAGGGAEFGSIVPLPGVPTSVERGGDWTLQRLRRELPSVAEAQALRASADAAAAADVTVLEEVRIDALDITILEGGADGVVEWARAQGFRTTPDLEEVLEFYARRSPIFMAARFDLAAARERGQQAGEGTPVHLTIPTSNPWVPLRILAAGSGPDEPVRADVFLLNDRRPALLPLERAGIARTIDRPADAALLDDLRSDRGMEWVPEEAWLTHVRVDAPAGELTYDLAVDAWGTGQPSRVAAGLVPPVGADAGGSGTPTVVGLAVAAAVAASVLVRRLAARTRPT